MEIFLGIQFDMRRKGLLYYNHPYSEVINFVQCLFILILMVTNIPTCIWFILIEAKSFSEQAEALFTFVPIFFGNLEYFALLWQRKELIEFIFEFQSMINDRK